MTAKSGGCLDLAQIFPSLRLQEERARRQQGFARHVGNRIRH